MIRILFVVFFHVMIFTLHTPIAVSGNSIQHVSLCNLVRYPERYTGISVIVSANYRRGFEQSYLYCLGCADLGKIWVFFWTASGPIKFKSHPKDSLLNDYDVDFSGRIYWGGSNWGKNQRNLNRSSYFFEVESVKKAKLICDEFADPSMRSIKVQKKVCGYESEKGPNKKQILGESALANEIHKATQAGDLKIIKALLKDNYELVFGKDKIGETPLHMAANLGYKGAVEQLLEKGAKVNSRDKLGETPLHLAAGSGHKDVAELLLAKGADVNAINNGGVTPLYMSYQKGRIDVVELLRRHGGTGEIDWNLVGIMNQSDLFLVVTEAGDIVKISDMLKDNPKLVYCRNKMGNTPLHLAMNMGYIDIVKLLLAKGADVNARDSYSSTPLHYAAKSGRKDIAELLLAKGAEVNAKDRDGQTPLSRAVQNFRIAEADLLRQHGGEE